VLDPRNEPSRAVTSIDTTTRPRSVLTRSGLRPRAPASASSRPFHVRPNMGRRSHRSPRRFSNSVRGCFRDRLQSRSPGESMAPLTDAEPQPAEPASGGEGIRAAVGRPGDPSASLAEAVRPRPTTVAASLIRFARSSTPIRVACRGCSGVARPGCAHRTERGAGRRSRRSVACPVVRRIPPSLLRWVNARRMRHCAQAIQPSVTGPMPIARAAVS
jgi:hypothetical protein